MSEATEIEAPHLLTEQDEQALTRSRSKRQRLSSMAPRKGFDQPQAERG